MKERYLKKLLLIFSGLILFTYAIVSACGGGWDLGFNYKSDYTPEAFNIDASYTPLLLSDEFFYDIGFDDAHNSRFNDDIVNDWSSFLGESIDKEVLKYFLLDEKSRDDVNGLNRYFQTGDTNLKVEKWIKSIAINDTNFKSFVEFLYLAKQVEIASVAAKKWTYEPVKYKALQDLSILELIEEKYNETQDPFLKNRYWFQTIKANFYSLNAPRSEKEFFYTTEFFEKTKDKTPKNILYYRALSYIAGIYYKVPNYSMSNYLYSKVFDDCPPLRTVAAYSFHPQKQENWEKTLELATSNKEKAALLAVQAYYSGEINAMEQIFDLDPTNKHLDYLLTRLVNHQEEKIKEFSKDVDFDINKRAQYSLINKDALTLISKIANSNKTNNSFLWTASLGYLQTLNGDYENAEKSFKNAEKSIPKTKLAENQLRLLRFINELNKITEIDEVAVQRILPDLYWLFDELPNNTEGGEFRFYNAADWSKKYIASLYRKQGNFVMAEMFQPGINTQENYFYDDGSKLKSMEDFFLRKDHSELEELALKLYSIDISDLYYYKAVLATFSNDIPKALQQFEKSKKNVSLLANPFNGFIQDNHDFEHAKNKPFEVRAFLHTVNEMQQKLANEEDVYNNSILLGNAFYNITHFGNGRVFYEASVIMGSGSSPIYFRSGSMRFIIDCSVAESYYRIAHAHAHTKEQKAKSAYMLAKCERNKFYNNKYYYQNINPSYWSKDDNIDFLAWKGFEVLKKEYSDTEYYKEVINECGYFRTYVGKN